MKLRTYARVLVMTLMATFALATVVATVSPEAANATTAAGGFVMTPSGPNLFQDQEEAVRGTSKHAASTGDYPWNSSPKSVGVDARSGSNLTQYLGEVPEALKDEDECKDLYYYGGKIKDGNLSYDRTFQTRESCDDKDTLQYKALERNQGNPAGSAFSAVTSSIVWLMQQLNNLLLIIKNLDLIGFIDDASGGLLEQIKKVLIWNDEGPAVPLMVALGVFILSLIPTIWKVAKGDGGTSAVWSKLGVLGLSFLLIGAALSNAPSVINKWSSELAGSLQTSLITASTGTDGSSCSYQTSDDDMDAIRTIYCGQMKPVFENAILNQFGYSSSELNVEEFPNWSPALSTAFGNKEDGTPKNPFEKTTNLGWYWANSQTNITSRENFTDNKSRTADNQRAVLIIDFLDQVRIANEGDQATLDKVETIAQHMSQPNYSGHGVNNLLLIIYYVLNLIVMFQLTAFTLVGVVSVALIGVIIIATPILVYFKPELVKDILKTYVMGFLRILIGAVLVVVYSSLTAVLFAGNFYAAIAVSIVLGLALAKYGPRLIRQLNQAITKHETFAPVRSMNREMNRFIYNRGGAENAKQARKARGSQIAEERSIAQRNEENLGATQLDVENDSVAVVGDTSLLSKYNQAQIDLANGKITQAEFDAIKSAYMNSREYVSTADIDDANKLSRTPIVDVRGLDIQGAKSGTHVVIQNPDGTYQQIDQQQYNSMANKPRSINVDDIVNDSADATSRNHIANNDVAYRDSSTGKIVFKTREESDNIQKLQGMTEQSKSETLSEIEENKKTVRKQKKRVIFKSAANMAGATTETVMDSTNEASVVTKTARRVITNTEKKEPEMITFNKNEF